MDPSGCVRQRWGVIAAVATASPLVCAAGCFPLPVSSADAHAAHPHDHAAPPADESQVRQYLKDLKGAMDVLTKKNRRLRRAHEELSDIVVGLMSVDLVRQVPICDPISGWWEYLWPRGLGSRVTVRRHPVPLLLVATVHSVRCGDAVSRQIRPLAPAVTVRALERLISPCPCCGNGTTGFPPSPLPPLVSPPLKP